MNQEQIIPMPSYPLSERLTLRPNRTDREAELAQAVEETTEFYLLPLIERMEKLRSFWTRSRNCAVWKASFRACVWKMWTRIC